MVSSDVWTLSSGCCSTDQYIFIITTGVYLVFDMIFWSFTFMRPFKLLGVFVHEMCHAIACWMTCGSVKGLEVHLNEGGVTKYVGGWRTLVTPAGYLGGALWGAVTIVCSSYIYATYAISVILVLALLVALFKADNWTLRVLCISFIGLLALFAALAIREIINLMPFVTLFIGVFVLVFSVYDIYDDTIRRTVAESDASACFDMYPCCPPVGWGVIWAILGMLFFAASIYFSLVILEARANDKSFVDPSHP